MRTNRQLLVAPSMTVGPLKNTVKHCLLLRGTPNQTFAYKEDLFTEWDKEMSHGLTPHGPFEGDSKPETAYEKARRANVDIITRAGSLLLPIARSYNYAAQDEMLSRVNAFCSGERSWHLASVPTPAPTTKQPWNRISEVNNAMAQFEALPIGTQKSMEGTLASILLGELSRRTPVSPYVDAKARELAIGLDHITER